MEAFISPLWEALKYRVESGDTINRLHYEYTPMIMCILCMTLMAKQYVGNPVQCWFPAEFHDSWEAYAETYCYVKNTYVLPISKYIPKSFDQREATEINYYQWVPIFLGLQAVLFYTPSVLYAATVDQSETWCFFKSTYWMDMREELPDQFHERRKNEVGYYQWLPIILVIQGILFHLPLSIWAQCHERTGLNVKGILNAVAAVRKDIDKGTRTGKVELAAQHISEALQIQREMKPAGRFCGFLFYGAHYGTYVTGLYLFIKLLYLINVAAQLAIMNQFLGTSYDFWGFGILRDLMNGIQWEESSHFPRVTMCDFKVRVLGNIHNWTVQCVLMINMFNEKIYIFLWWWFLFLAILTVLSFFYWIFAACLKSQRLLFVEKYLRVYGMVQSPPTRKESQYVRNFVLHHLRSDGVFILRMIQGNTGDLVTGDLIQQMYQDYMSSDENSGRDSADGFTENMPFLAEELPEKKAEVEE